MNGVYDEPTSGFWLEKEAVLSIMLLPSRVPGRSHWMRWPSVASSVKWKPYHALLGVFGSEMKQYMEEIQCVGLSGIRQTWLNQNCLLRLGSLLRGRALGREKSYRSQQSWHQSECGVPTRENNARKEQTFKLARIMQRRKRI